MTALDIAAARPNQGRDAVAFDDLRDFSERAPTLEFRVVRSGLPTRRLQLNTSRCTFGSGDGCTVRLNDPTLRSLHAVILRDTQRVLLRGYTVPIEVNGQYAAEAFLKPGDSFSLGSYQFILLNGPVGRLEKEIGDAWQESGKNDAIPAVSSSSSFNQDADQHHDRDLPLRMLNTPLQIAEDLDNASNLFQELTVGSAKPHQNRSSEASKQSPRRASFSRPSSNDSSATPRRLSFVGGSTFVSEAIQSVDSFGPANEFEKAPAAGHDRVTIADRAHQRNETEQLRQEVEAWRAREQQWRSQDAQTRSQLGDAVARFEQTQQRADEASDAVAQMRIRLAQLTAEMEAIAIDAVDFREQAMARQNRLQQAADDATQARSEAVRQRTMAIEQRDQAIQQFDDLAVAGQAAIGEREAVIGERDQAHREREDAFIQIAQKQRESEQAKEERDGARLAEEAAINERNLAQQELLDIRGQHERLLVSFNEIKERQENDSQAFNASQFQLASLNEQLLRTAAQLQDARAEIVAAYSRMDALSQESIDHQTGLQQQTEQDEALQVMRDQLNAQERRRQADHASWEQESAGLQETIQQLSMDLATATSQMSQIQIEHEATQAELNTAYERLTLARSELNERPTPEQYTSLEQKLQCVETQLTNAEVQLENLLRDYKSLCDQTSDQSQGAVNNVSKGDAFVVMPTSHATTEAIGEIGEQSDYDWPTYETSKQQMIDRPPMAAIPSSFNFDVTPTVDESEPEPPNDLSEESVVAYQSTWATPNEAFVPHSEGSSDWQSPFVNDGERASVGVEDNNQSVQAGVENDSIGSVAKRLIAELEAARKSEPSYEEPELSQSIGAWASAWNPNEAAGDWQSINAVVQTESISHHDVPSDEVPSDFNPSADDEHEHTQIFANGSRPPFNEGLDDFDHAANVTANFGWDRSTTLPEEMSDSPSPFADDEFAQPEPNDALDIDRTCYADPSQYALPEPEEAIEEVEEVTATQSYTSISPMAAPLANTNSDDDSIEAYMNRLLQRVQGQSAVPASLAPATPVATTPAPELVAPTNSTVTRSTTSTKVSEVIDTSAPMIPRSQAPEDAGNLAAMRAIANESANSAISISVRAQGQQLKSKAVMDLLQSGVVMICAFAFYTCGNKITNLRLVWFTAAALALALALFFFFDMLKKLSLAKAAFARANAQSDPERTEIAP